MGDGLRGWSGATLALAFFMALAASLSAPAPLSAETAPPRLVRSDAAATGALAPPPARAPIPVKRPPLPFVTPARAAFIYEAATGRVLYAKAADRASHPASLTKMMTAFVVLEAVEAGLLSAETRVALSAKARAQPGSSMRLAAGGRPTVAQLVKGLFVASGNDAAVALAEHLSGSEAAFAERMNEAAGRLGLEDSRFANATGFTANGHAMSPRDVARLSLALIERFPRARPIYAATSIRWGGVRQRNRNPVLFMDLARLGLVAEGMKTGHTRAAGYTIAAVARSARRPARRYVVVLYGLRSEAARAREARRALAWAARAAAAPRD